ncbi:hypothetical protein B0H14DRAFT_1229594 [Mycena olivaceomarginata]|nr:hypothetical protein B0H14DRAFT_1229594 [Mycena olivaceomarginata]
MKERSSHRLSALIPAFLSAMAKTTGKIRDDRRQHRFDCCHWYIQSIVTVSPDLIFLFIAPIQAKQQPASLLANMNCETAFTVRPPRQIPGGLGERTVERTADRGESRVPPRTKA